MGAYFPETYNVMKYQISTKSKIKYFYQKLKIPYIHFTRSFFFLFTTPLYVTIQMPVCQIELLYRIRETWERGIRNSVDVEREQDLSIWHFYRPMRIPIFNQSPSSHSLIPIVSFFSLHIFIYLLAICIPFWGKIIYIQFLCPFKNVWLFLVCFCLLN